MTAGDKVFLITPFKKYTYVVTKPFDGHANPWITDPKDFSVVAEVPGKSYLTLTSCHPKGSAKQRIILRLELQPKLTEDLTKKGAA